MTQFVHKDPTMYGVLERGMGGMFVGLGSGETDEQSVFLRGEFSPVRGVENVGRVFIIAKGCYVVNDDVWRRDGTRKSSSLDTSAEGFTKCVKSGQSRRLPGAARSCASRLRKNAEGGVLLRNDAREGALPLDPIKGKPLKSFNLRIWGFGVSNPNGVQGQSPWPFSAAC